MYKTYKTQKELKTYTRKVVDDIKECESIKNSHPEQYDFFMWLFERHPDYPEKFNKIVDIQIRYNPSFSTQLECVIINSDGSKQSVSVLKTCITGKKKDPLDCAMRSAIRPQISEFKKSRKKNNTLICDICGIDNTIHIDHKEPQFTDLKQDFLVNCKEKIPSNFKQDKGNIKVFIDDDKKFKENWVIHHKKYARLRPLCKKHNLSRKKSRRSKCSI